MKRRRRERAELRLARRMTSLPPRVVRRLAGKPIRVDGQELNPQLQLILRLRATKGVVGATAGTPERSRDRLLGETRTFAGEPKVGGPVRGLQIPGPAGMLPARHYDPGVGGAAPLIVFYHGGGHVIGSLDTHDQPCRILCRHAGAHVVSVEYRKAPEDPFPAAADDAIAAFNWIAARAAELGADPARLAVAGDSAGGNLAAVVAGIAARSDGPAPVLQLLIYPGLERATRRPSVDLFGEGFFLTEEDIDWFFKHYVPEPDLTDPRLTPAAHGDLSGFPAAIVVTAGFDPLRDEAEEYAEDLRAAGVPVLVRRFSDLSHGIVNMTGVSSDCYDAVVEMAGMTRAALGLSAPSPTPGSSTPAPGSLAARG
jgi:acetyl esterase